MILFNPTRNKFSVTYDTNNDGKPITYEIMPTETADFDEPIYSHVKKHLIDFVVNERGVNPTFKLEVDSIEKEINADLWTDNQ